MVAIIEDENLNPQQTTSPTNTGTQPQKTRLPVKIDLDGALEFLFEDYRSPRALVYQRRLKPKALTHIRDLIHATTHPDNTFEVTDNTLKLLQELKIRALDSGYDKAELGDVNFLIGSVLQKTSGSKQKFLRDISFTNELSPIQNAVLEPERETKKQEVSTGKSPTTPTGTEQTQSQDLSESSKETIKEAAEAKFSISRTNLEGAYDANGIAIPKALRPELEKFGLHISRMSDDELRLLSSNPSFRKVLQVYQQDPSLSNIEVDALQRVVDIFQKQVREFPQQALNPRLHLAVDTLLNNHLLLTHEGRIRNYIRFTKEIAEARIEGGDLSGLMSKAQEVFENAVETNDIEVQVFARNAIETIERKISAAKDFQQAEKARNVLVNEWTAMLFILAAAFSPNPHEVYNVWIKAVNDIMALQRGHKEKFVNDKELDEALDIITENTLREDRVREEYLLQRDMAIFKENLNLESQKKLLEFRSLLTSNSPRELIKTLAETAKTLQQALRGHLELRDTLHNLYIQSANSASPANQFITLLEAQIKQLEKTRKAEDLEGAKILRKILEATKHLNSNKILDAIRLTDTGITQLLQSMSIGAILDSAEFNAFSEHLSQIDEEQARESSSIGGEKGK